MVDSGTINCNLADAAAGRAALSRARDRGDGDNDRRGELAFPPPPGLCSAGACHEGDATPAAPPPGGLCLAE